jgi:predicted permease
MLADLLYRIRALFKRTQVERELSDELRFHFGQHVEKLRRTGLSEEEATRQAHLSFGGIEQIKEECREARGVALIEALIQDLAYAVRVLRRSPGFTLAVSLSLALGIGANTAIFSISDAVMWRMLPVERPEELLLLTHGQGSSFESGFTFQQYRLMRRHNQVLEDLAAWSPVRLNVSVDGSTEPTTHGQLVSGSYFAVLGVRPAAGRAIGAEDDVVPNGHPVAMISHAYWKRRFGLAPEIIGKSIVLSGRSFTIIGVTPAEFFGVEVGTAPDLFVPIQMQPSVMPDSEDLLMDRPGQYLTWIHALGRLKPGIHPRQAAEQLEVFFRQEIPRGGKYRRLEAEKLALMPAATGLSALRREFSQPLLILMILVGIMLLIACANTANLLLARAAARQPEFAMRVALGARRPRLMGQLLVESVVLSIAGGALGVLLAGQATGLLVGFLSAGKTSLALELHPNLRVLAFTAAVSIATGLLFGIVPAIRATRLAAGPALYDRSGTGGLRSGKIFAVVQVALSLLLLVGAGLFLRTLGNLERQDSGITPESVLVVRVEPRGSDQRGVPGVSARLDRTYRDLIQRVTAIPAVRSASMAQFTPTNPRGMTVPFRLSSGEESRVFVAMVYPNYFATMGISISAGRDFHTGDLGERSPLVAVVSETFGRQAFPGQNPVGQQIQLGRETREIIGVTKDSHFASLRGEIPAIVYQPFLQTNTGRGQMALYVRVDGSPRAAIPHIRDAVQAVDRHLPMFDIHTLAEEVDSVLVRERLMATLSGMFGLLALVLASVGLYGLFAFAVAQRTREIGIRMALGAQRRTVVWTVMREVLVLVLLGISLGIPATLAGALLASSQISGLLYNVKPGDPLTMARATLVLVFTAALAGYLPARRASLVNPVTALRNE